MGRVVGIRLNACILCEIVQLFSQLIFLNAGHTRMQIPHTAPLPIFWYAFFI